jgi:hypothetical protein
MEVDGMELIPERIGRKIAIDAELAIDALNAIIICKDCLHPAYLKEKCDRVERCLEYIKHYCAEEKK